VKDNELLSPNSNDNESVAIKDVLKYYASISTLDKIFLDKRLSSTKKSSTESEKEKFVITNQNSRNKRATIRHKYIDKNGNGINKVILTDCLLSDDGTRIVDKKLDAFTHKVLTYILTLLLAANGGTLRKKTENKITGTVSMGIKDFTDFVGLKNTPVNRSRMRKDVVKSLDTVQSMIISYKHPLQKKSFDDISIISRKTSGRKGIRISKISINFTNDFLEILSKQSYVNEIPAELYKTSKDVYLLGFAFCQQRLMNSSKKRQDIHRVDWILDHLEISANNHRFKERIKNTFETAMNKLSFMVVWKYIDANNNEIEQNSIKDKNTFLSLKIKLYWKYPSKHRAPSQAYLQSFHKHQTN
jgi:hypothetical protein